MKRTYIRGLTITRWPNAKGTNLADKSQPIIRVEGQGFNELLGKWSTLCLPSGAIQASQATDAQIAKALLSDESIFN
ncbi:hypothetical protein LCGC14_1918880 [marine sediment metagenome]|uniref:Uncharacterized protein n=1 Tax=marine sediment metagenome TaxID=412755 RepID=A0A0F9FR65_9ZZZZ